MGNLAPSIAECKEMATTCACYNLRRAARAVTQVFDAHLDAVGLRATQFTVLAAVAWCDERPPTVTFLADSLVLDQSSLSRNLAVLERNGYVSLVPGEDDARERMVSLTRAGRAVLARGYPLWRRAQAAVADAVDPRQLDRQLGALRTMTAAALEVTPERRARKRGKSSNGSKSSKSSKRSTAGSTRTQARTRRNAGKTASRRS